MQSLRCSSIAYDNKSYYYEADKFLLSTKVLFVEFVAQIIAIAITSYQYQLPEITAIISMGRKKKKKKKKKKHKQKKTKNKNDQLPHEL